MISYKVLSNRIVSLNAELEKKDKIIKELQNKIWESPDKDFTIKLLEIDLMNLDNACKKYEVTIQNYEKLKEDLEKSNLDLINQLKKYKDIEETNKKYITDINSVRPIEID